MQIILVSIHVNIVNYTASMIFYYILQFPDEPSLLNLSIRRILITKMYYDWLWYL